MDERCCGLLGESWVVDCCEKPTTTLVSPDLAGVVFAYAIDGLMEG
jgi:hypothetical protein